MSAINANEILTQKFLRHFIQIGGPRPNNPVEYAGKDTNYMKHEGVTSPITGSIDPIWVHDPHRPGKYRPVGRSITPADLPTSTLVLLEKHGSIPRQLAALDCPLNLYTPSGPCKDLSDFLSGWTDYVHIHSNGLVTERDLGNRTSWDSDDAIEDSLSITWAVDYVIGAFAFGEAASTEVSKEVIDIVYGSTVQCGDCGPADDGTNKIYAVTKSSGSGSPGLPAEVVYTVDGGASWTGVNINGFGATEDPVAIDIAGDKLIVIGSNAYYYATLNSLTGVPGTWTKVTSGFVAGKAPTDLYVAGPREIYFSANGGYIYKSTDITVGVSVLSAANATSNDLLRIHGEGETIVAVGRASTVLVSLNRGVTFATTTTNPSNIALDVTAVRVLDQFRYWVGTSNSGRVFYTLNGGETWSQKGFEYTGIGNVTDIVFATDEVGYFAHDFPSGESLPLARVFTTWNGGADWTNQRQRILNFPVFGRANRLAVPLDVNPTTMANNLAIAGLSGDLIDGVIYIASASIF